MKTFLINEKVNFQFITPLAEYEKDIQALAKTKFKFTYEDVTKENSPIIFAEGRKEVIITVESLSIKECGFVSDLIRNLK